MRAIALQFTIGGHADKTGRLRQMSTVYADFRRLCDGELGTVDYRRSVQILTREKDTWIKRSEEEIVGGPWPTRVVTKQEFDGEWPFRVDRVILEQRDATFYIAYINGYAFALNGAARSLDLAALRSNRLEVLRGDRAGQHSIRINAQWRICFVWTDDGPCEVEIVDYH